MSELEETWTEKSFYNKPLRVWLGNEDSLYENCPQLDLFTAASIGCYERVKEIIHDDKNLCNQKNRSEWTAMMYAAHYGHLEIITLLLDAKASVHIRNQNGCNALMVAAMCGNDVIVETLMKAGSILETRDNRDWTALFHAVCTGYHNVVSTLLKYRININSCERRTGMTPLMYAAHMGDKALARVLLQKGASASLTTHQGHTAARIAQDAGFHEVAAMITMAGLQATNSQSVFDGPAVVEAWRAEQMLVNRTRGSSATPSVDNTNVQPTDLETLLNQLGLGSYVNAFREQGVDLQLFLTLTDQELKECGILKLGPRRKMTSAIARWHSNAPIRSGVECAYADKLEVEMQELGMKLAEAMQALRQAKDQVNQENDLRVVTEGLIVEARGRLQECHQRSQRLMSHIGTVQQYISIVTSHPPTIQTPLMQPAFWSTVIDAITHIADQAESILALTDPNIPRDPCSPLLQCSAKQPKGNTNVLK